jgi:Protein of unknown function (DUF1360)
VALNVPGWYTLLLLGAAAFRCWQLVAVDDIFDGLRRNVTRLGSDWQKEGDALPEGYRIKLAAFLSCSWCLGFWLALGWWGCWQAWPHGTTVAAVPLAIATLVPLTERLTSGTSE